MEELKETPRRIAEELAATPEEILVGIEALTEGQLVKLQRYAKYRMRGLGRKAIGRDHEDLLTEAMTATLAGNRRWNKNAIDFFTHLVGVMRSISSHWAEQFSLEEPFLESEFRGEGENGSSRLFLNEPTDAPGVDRILSAKEELRRIEIHFAADPLIPRLIESLKEGLTGPEIQARYHITKRAYESGMKRLRRGVISMEKEEQGTSADGTVEARRLRAAGFSISENPEGEKYVH